MHSQNKELIDTYRAALYDCDVAALQSQLYQVFTANAVIHLASPFEDLDGPDGLYEQAFLPLITAIPDLERRDFIVMAGESNGTYWVGCGGHYIGTFQQPWLDIPPTQHAIHMRYHEFFRVEDNKVVEMQALWDIPALMMQANAWPMMPALGVEWLVPGPATQDGLAIVPDSNDQTATSLKTVVDMLVALGKYPLGGGPEVMELERFWHPKFLWYGPAGIGSMRGIDGFRRWHQTPFLKAMPDRRGGTSNKSIFFGEGNYVGTTGWPNMQMTFTGDGWLSLPPTNRELTMRSLSRSKFGVFGYFQSRLQGFWSHLFRFRLQKTTYFISENRPNLTQKLDIDRQICIYVNCLARILSLNLKFGSTEPGLLALRKRSHPRKLGAGGSASCVRSIWDGCL
ncbi:ester cyclase [Chloroflexi bacterium TSY]|nr:ester cyclase [Chloroflexi bacterium TSY]